MNQKVHTFYLMSLILLLVTLAGCGKTASKSEISQRTSAYSTRLPSTGTVENAAPTHQSGQILEATCFADKNMLRWRSKTTSAINYQIRLIRGNVSFSYVILCESQERCKPTMNGMSIEPKAYVETTATGDSRSFEFSDNRDGFSDNYGYRYEITAFSQSSGVQGGTVAVPECTEYLGD